MTPKRWSLAKRLTRWFSGVALLPGLAAYLLGGFTLEWWGAREIDELMNEEVQEACGQLRQTTDPVAAFAAVCAELTSHHPATPLAWRLTDPVSGRVLAETGNLSRFPEGIPAGETLDLGDGFHARTVDLSAGARLLIGLDARSHRAFVERYWLVGILLIAASTLAAIAIGHFVARRVAGMLSQVADDVHSSHGGALASRQGAPDEIRAIVDQLRAELQRIREDSERARLFTAGLAHELRSPLQNLISQTEVSLLRQREPAEYETTMTSQLDELMQLADAIDNLLAICARGGPAPEAPERFDVGKEAELRLGRELARATREGIGLDVHVEGDTRIAGNRENALRGIRNVVGNAIDWTPRGGRIEVSIVGEPGQVVVTVDDSGPGVPEDQRERIFETFVRGAARAGRRVGYGLGLAIAKASVADHGGGIGVATSSLGGARFRLTFARDGAPEQPRPTPAR